MALTQLLGGPEWDVFTFADQALFADFHYFFNSGSVIRTNPWNSPQAPIAKVLNVKNITANSVVANYVSSSGQLTNVILTSGSTAQITSQTLPLGLDNNNWLSASIVSDFTGSITARPTGSRWFELQAIRTSFDTYVYTIPDGSTDIIRTTTGQPSSGSLRYRCSRTIPYLDQPVWIIRDLYDCTGGTTTTTTTAGPTTTTTTTTLAPNFIQYLVVAGGGGGGYGGAPETAGAGGGAGGWLSGSATLAYSSTPIAVTIGAGGLGAIPSPFSNSTNGGNSGFYDLVADGGGRGGLNGNAAQSNGGNGGSGGGAVINNIAGTGIAGEGFNGSVGTYVNAGSYRGGNGGGAGSAPYDTNNRIAGNGKVWLDGNRYAAGGIGYNATAGLGSGTLGSGGNAGNSTLSVPTTNGQSGVVIIRYFGVPRATGGTITQSGGFTYHTFTTSGDFTFNGVTTTTTTTAGPGTTTTTTLASQKYLLSSCIGPRDIFAVFTIINAPLLNAGATIRIANAGGIGGYYCFSVNGTSFNASNGTYSISNVWQDAAGDCIDCTE
jgi:hypothetical protein